MLSKNESQRLSLPHGFTISTQFACTGSELWAAIARMDQINRELAPFLRMTAPSEARDKTIEDMPLGQRAFTSVILLFGIVPIDLHFVHLTERDSGRRFVEKSHTLVNATWRHERTIDPALDGRGCQITDRIDFRTRLPLLGRLLLPLIRRLFAHRHRQILARFGAPGDVAKPAVVPTSDQIRS